MLVSVGSIRFCRQHYLHFFCLLKWFIIVFSIVGSSGGLSVLVTEKNIEEVANVEMVEDSGKDVDDGEVEMVGGEEEGTMCLRINCISLDQCRDKIFVCLQILKQMSLFW